ncbi:hypothetical protein [uncultured Roseovarius sp.]|mgnify:CR=1 FL=1|uniref:hypothetical protein n=1 Tax=uncultured Roseovarius sp. TaxID=293344 RepID=UPI0025F855F3|nr:hypothetical protein [uncultured Roseovarius sp.]
MKKSEGPLLHGKDQLRAILEQLRQPHERGNPFALFETIHLAQNWRLPLPSWASDVSKQILVGFLTGGAAGKVGKSNSPLSRYRESLKPSIRARTYQSIMSWSREPLFYKSMPTSVIEKWYRKEIFPNDVNSENAVEFSVKALKGTFAECEADTLIKQKYYDPISELEEEFESLRDPEEDRSKIPKEVKDQIRDQFLDPTGIHDWSIEATDELISMLDFFGPPPGDPPPHVVELLRERRRSVNWSPIE